MMGVSMLPRLIQRKIDTCREAFRMDEEQGVSGYQRTLHSNNLAQRQQDIDSVERGTRLALEVLRDISPSSHDSPGLNDLRDKIAGRLWCAIDFLLLPAFDDDDGSDEGAKES